VTLTVADIDRWSAEAVRAVFDSWAADGIERVHGRVGKRVAVPTLV
jgi:hypothetical protein